MTLKEALDILGLDSDASPKDVKKAFRKLAKRYHPDKTSTSNTETMFRRVNEAYEYWQQAEDLRQQAETKQQSEEQRQTDDAISRGNEKREKQQTQTKAIGQRTNSIWGYYLWGYCLITWILAGFLFLDKWYIDQIETLFVILFAPIAFPFVLVIFLTKSLYY